MSKSVLLTGSTGYLGQFLFDKLLDNKFKVTCLVRNIPDKQIKGVEYVIGDIVELNSLEFKRKIFDYVIHAAALTNAPKEVEDAWPLFRKVNVEGTINLLNAMPKDVKQFVFISSVDAEGSLKNLAEVDESYLGSPNSAYDRSKKLAEEEAMEFCKKNEIKYTIIRPGMIYGEGHSNPEMFKINNLIFMFAKIVKKGVFPILGNGKNRMPLVYVRNVVQGIVKTIGNKKAYNEVFILCDVKGPTFDELIDSLAFVLDKRYTKVHLPLWFLRIGIGFGDLVTKFVPIDLPLNLSGLKYLTTSRSYKVKKAKKFLKYRPISFMDSLKGTVEWYRLEKMV